MFGIIKTGETAAVTLRKVTVANQNKPLAVVKGLQEPQWYDVKYMVERMFDLRGRVRDAIEMRRHAEQLKIRINHPSRLIVTAEIHGHNMQIAMIWHQYREAVATYHEAWAVYQKNLRR